MCICAWENFLEDKLILLFSVEDFLLVISAEKIQQIKLSSIIMEILIIDVLSMD